MEEEFQAYDRVYYVFYPYIYPTGKSYTRWKDTYKLEVGHSTIYSQVKFNWIHLLEWETR